MNKKIIVLGGGTFSHVRTHQALAVPSFGRTAREIAKECYARFRNMDIVLALTKMASPDRSLGFFNSGWELVTNEDVEAYVDHLVRTSTTKIIFFSAGLCDFDGEINGIPSEKDAPRLQSAVPNYTMRLS